MKPWRKSSQYLFKYINDPYEHECINEIDY